MGSHCSAMPKKLGRSRYSHPVAGAIWAQMPNILYNLAFEKPTADALIGHKIISYKKISNCFAHCAKYQLVYDNCLRRKIELKRDEMSNTT